ncbi:MAG: Flp pilus assembly protein CpaB [Coriobacteriia bacterium]|nr:Flp pilus assembly protein CpaB [Coriobacteriia bacterium]MBS5478030.1 Flp pilus assembly protein CpaB [Coriobacteriia bacterium]
MSMRVRIVLCAISAVVAVVLMQGYAAIVRGQAAGQRTEALERYGGETARVCVTTAFVARGETLSERNVTTVDWLVDLLPEGALVDEGQVLGKVAASAMAANTPISDVDLEAQTSALDVPAGTTAVSVPCSVESAVGGALVPGSVVDLYLVSEGTARLLSPSVRVLQTSSGTSGGKLAWVTVAVDPSHVEAIVAAASMQRLSFVLPADDVARETGRLRVSESAAGDAPAPDPPSETGAVRSEEQPADADAAGTEQDAAGVQE